MPTKETKETKKDFAQKFRNAIVAETGVPLSNLVFRRKLTDAILTDKNAIEKYLSLGETVVYEVIPAKAERQEILQLHSQERIIEELSFERIGDDRIRISCPAKKLVSVDELNDLLEPIRTLSSLYTLLAVFSFSNYENLLLYFENRKKISVSSMNKLLLDENIPPLKVVSLHYGSPLIGDVLGLGSLIENTYNVIQRFKWKDRTEKKKMELEIAGMEIENLMKAINLYKEYQKLENSKLSQNQKDMMLGMIRRQVKKLISSTEVKASVNKKKNSKNKKLLP